MKSRQGEPADCVFIDDLLTTLQFRGTDWSETTSILDLE